MGSKGRGDEEMESLSVENPLQEFGYKGEQRNSVIARDKCGVRESFCLCVFVYIHRDGNYSKWKVKMVFKGE